MYTLYLGTAASVTSKTIKLNDCVATRATEQIHPTDIIDKIVIEPNVPIDDILQVSTLKPNVQLK
jgi:hypothetical protein